MHRLLSNALNWRQAESTDLGAIQSLFADVREELAQRGLDLWQHGYPNRALIRSDMERCALFVGTRSEQLVVAVTLDSIQAPEYADIAWNIPSQRPLVIHRLGVLPSVQGQGIGKAAVAWCEQWGIERGCDAIRLDTYTANRRNMGFYERLGYDRPAGAVYFPPNTHAFCGFEKRLG